MLTIKIETDNAAFRDNGEGVSDEECTRYECARILKKIADDLEFGAETGKIHDVNGNHVGDWSL